jgi:hypothetical protein
VLGEPTGDEVNLGAGYGHGEHQRGGGWLACARHAEPQTR